jgi:hypothetical protein
MHNREKHLSLLSGMTVKREVLIKDGSEHTVYTFYKSNGDTAKQFFTYPKAKAFAEGINFARSEKPQFTVEKIKFPDEPVYQDEDVKKYILYYRDISIEKHEYADGNVNYLICKGVEAIAYFSK